MKHLKKYNESKDDVDIDYIQDCFIEFKDDPIYKYELEDNEDYLISIGVDILPTPRKVESEYKISELVEFSKKLYEFYLDIENCIDKVKLKYPNIKYFCEEGIYTEKNNNLNRRFLWVRFE